VLFSLASRERLTAPGATAEDTEKTVVSLYSKVKESAGAAIFTRPCLGKCYNVTLWGHTSSTVWMTAVGRRRDGKMGREL
jgi:hypothetical protein